MHFSTGKRQTQILNPYTEVLALHLTPLFSWVFWSSHPWIVQFPNFQCGITLFLDPSLHGKLTWLCGSGCWRRGRERKEAVRACSEHRKRRTPTWTPHVTRGPQRPPLSLSSWKEQDHSSVTRLRTPPLPPRTIFQNNADFRQFMRENLQFWANFGLRVLRLKSWIRARGENGNANPVHDHDNRPCQNDFSLTRAASLSASRHDNEL